MAHDPDRREAAEADRLFDATLRRMLKTPPKPHEDMKLGKPRQKQRSSANDGEAERVKQQR